MEKLLANQDSWDVMMIIIFIMICASIAAILISSYRKEKKTIVKEEKDLPNLEAYKKDSRVSRVLPRTEKELKEEKEKMELEIVLKKMREDLANKDTDIVRTFEEEQEEKSVISYQELLKKKNEANKKVDFIGDKSEQVEELDFDFTPLKKEEPKKEEVKRPEVKIEDIKLENTKPVEPKKDPKSNVREITEELRKSSECKKFKKSEFISPVYGRIEANLDYPKINLFKETVKETLTNDIKIEDLEIKDIEEEIAKSERFLNQLKDFRKSLE